MAVAAILKNKKSLFLRNGLTDRHEIWHDDAGGPSRPSGLSDFRLEVEIRQFHTYALENHIMDSAMGHLPRSTEPISSLLLVLYLSLWLQDKFYTYMYSLQLRIGCLDKVTLVLYLTF